MTSESSGLLLGHSSLTLKGLQGLPGVTRAECAGEIKVIQNTFQVTPEAHIAQLVILPLKRLENL